MPTLFPVFPQRAQCLLKMTGGKEKPLMRFPHSCPLSVAFFVCVWLCRVMINTLGHGKRVAATIRGIVLVHKSTVSPVSASQVHLADPWEPAAGIRKE